MESVNFPIVDMDADEEEKLVAFVVKTYRDIFYNNLSVNFDRDNVTADEVSRDGGNCVLLCRHFMAVMNHLDYSIHYSLKRPQIREEELQDKNLNHVILLRQTENVYEYIELAGSDSRIQTVPSEYDDHYGNTNEIEKDGEWIKHFKTIKGEKKLHCAVNLSKTYGHDEAFHKRFMSSVKSQLFRSFSIRYADGPPIAAMTIDLSKAMTVSASPFMISVTWRITRLNKKKAAKSKYIPPQVDAYDEYSVTTAPRGDNCSCSSFPIRITMSTDVYETFSNTTCEYLQGILDTTIFRSHLASFREWLGCSCSST